MGWGFLEGRESKREVMWLELEGWMERSERMEEQLKGYNRLAKDMGQRRTQKNRVKVPPRFLISDNTWMLALFLFFSFVLFCFFFLTGEY